MHSYSFFLGGARGGGGEFHSGGSHYRTLQNARLRYIPGYGAPGGSRDTPVVS